LLTGSALGNFFSVRHIAILQLCDMPLSNELTTALMDVLHTDHRGPVTLKSTVPIGGGSINDGYRLETSAGNFFVKVNSADRFPSMFEAEADGLERLRGTGELRVPEVLAVGEILDVTFLLLEHIDPGERTPIFWERSGRRLAAMHRHTDPEFGSARDNFIGSLKQVNTRTEDWSAFFIHHRLEPQLKMARDKKKVKPGSAFRFERLFGKLDTLFPKEPPALIHGDLWNGNFLCDEEQDPVLIDPAVYFGHREMDVAMSRLFGGFDPEFYRAYNDAWPMEQGWEERMDLCNLYPLLVHVNLFGGSYAQQVDAVLRRFT